MGAIALSELRRLLYEGEALRHLVVARDLVDPNRPTVTGDDDLDVVMHLLSRSGVDELAVLDPVEPGRLIGSVHQKDVIETRNREMLRRDLAGGLSTGVSAAQHGQSIDLGGGFLLLEVMAPAAGVGRSLRDLDLRARTGVQVLLIREAGRAGRVRVPTADDVLLEGSRLVVAGTLEGLERLDRIR
jgi:hypothetical protein